MSVLAHRQPPEAVVDAWPRQACGSELAVFAGSDRVEEASGPHWPTESLQHAAVPIEQPRAQLGRGPGETARRFAGQLRRP